MLVFCPQIAHFVVLLRFLRSSGLASNCFLFSLRLVERGLLSAPAGGRVDRHPGLEAAASTTTATVPAATATATVPAAAATATAPAAVPAAATATAAPATAATPSTVPTAAALVPATIPAAIPATIASAASRALGRPRVGVDLEPASGSLLAVELTCGLFLLGRRKLDVSDALEVSRLPVGRQAHVADGSVLGKGLGELPPDLLLAQVLVKALDE